MRYYPGRLTADLYFTRLIEGFAQCLTPEEDIALARGDLEGFWLSRLHKSDPVARIGYTLWVSDPKLVKAEIRKNPEFWNHEGFGYWDFMARSTVVNLAAGLEKAGFHLSFADMRKKIKEVGVEIARQHTRFVRDDIKRNIGKKAGLLSLEQMAHYHHIAFAKFGIPADFYGGTWFGAIPDQWEMETYGGLYCHDCDTADGFSDRSVQ